MKSVPSEEEQPLLSDIAAQQLWTGLPWSFVPAAELHPFFYDLTDGRRSAAIFFADNCLGHSLIIIANHIRALFDQ